MAAGGSGGRAVIISPLTCLQVGRTVEAAERELHRKPHVVSPASATSIERRTP
jgi:hypothetical protein